MRDLNKVMLIGNLTRDPEIRSTSTGQSVASFSIALNRSWNDQQGVRQDAVEYIDIVAWGKLAEVVGQIYRKGRKTFVEGRLQTRSWEGQDGIKRQKTEVIAENLIILDRQMAGDAAGGRFDNQDQPAAVSSTAPEASPNSSSDDEINIEDIPF